jgi:signal transduction histidine kinase
MVFPLLVHLVAHAHGADSSRRAGRAIALLYLGTCVLAVAWLAAYVPWLEPRCVSLCDEVMVGPLADHRLARVLATTGQFVTVVAGVGLAAWAVARYARSTTVARRQTGRTLVPAALVGVAWAISAAASTQPSSVIPPLGDVMVTLFIARAVSASLLGLGLAWRLIDGRRTLLAVRRITNDLSPLPGGGSLRAALATALGDPGLELVFPLPEGAGYVDTVGATVPDPSMRPDSHGTPIADGGRIVAVAVGSGGGPTVPLQDDLGDAVRLAASNERLLAAVRHEILELQASRARIVEAGDMARHSLERDLHDGAQHRMLGVLHELSLGRARAVEAGDVEAAERLAGAIEEADDAIESLRRLARGIHPATLTDGGLLPALEALADEAAIPLEIDAPAGVRFPPEVEATAWRVVAQTVVVAGRLSADGVSAHVRLVGEYLELDLEIDGASSAPDTVALEDRVGAVGGSVSVRRDNDGVTRVHVELPCA